MVALTTNVSTISSFSCVYMCKRGTSKVQHLVARQIFKILGRPLLQFAAAADAAMQGLSMLSSVLFVGYRHLHLISESSANAKV